MNEAEILDMVRRYGIACADRDGSASIYQGSTLKEAIGRICRERDALKESHADLNKRLDEYMRHVEARRQGQI